jgi:hypothetical protein
VALLEQLHDRIVASYVEPDLVDCDGLHINVLVVTQPIEVGRDEGLHHERAVTGEVGGDVLEVSTSSPRWFRSS